jgi:hypothetical protein
LPRYSRDGGRPPRTGKGYLRFTLRSNPGSSGYYRGSQVGSFAVDAEAFAGGGWLDERREVLEIESGVVQLPVVAVDDDDSQ